MENISLVGNLLIVRPRGVFGQFLTILACGAFTQILRAVLIEGRLSKVPVFLRAIYCISVFSFFVFQILECEAFQRFCPCGLFTKNACSLV